MADEKQLEILQDKANFRSFKPKPFNMREFYDRAGHDIRDMLLSCHFRGEACSAEDFKVVSPWYGVCYPAPWKGKRQEAGLASLCLLFWERKPGVLGFASGRRGLCSADGAFVLHEGLSFSLASVMAGKKGCGMYYTNHPCTHSHTHEHTLPGVAQPLQPYILAHRDQS